MDTGILDGASVAVVRSGGVVYQGQVGDHKPDAMYILNSLTKVFTSVACLQLVDEGKLNLDDPVAKYLPSFKEPRRPGGAQADPNAITIKQCLNHTAGFHYLFNCVHPHGTMQPEEACEVEHIMPTLAQELDVSGFANGYQAKQALAFTPGTHFNYSNATNIVAAVVEAVSGKKLPAYMKEKLFEPMEMTDSCFEMSEAQKARCRRTPVDEEHVKEFDGLGAMAMVETGVDLFPTLPTARGDGGTKGTVADWINFATMFLNKGVYKGKRILSEASIKALQTNSLPGNAELVLYGVK